MRYFSFSVQENSKTPKLTNPFPCKMAGCGAEFSASAATKGEILLGFSSTELKGRHLNPLFCDLMTPPPDIKGWPPPKDSSAAKKIRIWGIFNILLQVHDAHWERGEKERRRARMRPKREEGRESRARTVGDIPHLPCFPQTGLEYMSNEQYKSIICLLKRFIWWCQWYYL